MKEYDKYDDIFKLNVWENWSSAKKIRLIMVVGRKKSSERA